MPLRHIVNPFCIDIDPMERLLLVNFEKDPDTTYVGFEPQVFDDPVNGTGHLVIGWRRDGRVDVFHQPGLHLDAAKYDIAGKGLAHMVERELSGATYEVDAFGVQAHYEFQDIHNRSVVININEQNPKERKPFGLLAPMGAAAEAPSALPLVLLHDFYFVRVRHTIFEISIDGRRHQPDRLPIPMDFTRMHFTRYSPRPLIATLNPAFDGELKAMEVARGQEEAHAGEHVLTLEWTADGPAIRRVIRPNAIHSVEMRFNAAFPCLETLKNGAVVGGNFEIEGHPSTGRVGGRYTVAKKDVHIEITLIPAQGWQPRPTKFSLRFLYTVASVFRKWPTTYKWTALIEKNTIGVYVMRSTWRRFDVAQIEQMKQGGIDGYR
ncbi:MAG: hypothetical protein ACK47M_05535 [Caldilinea sp.]